MSNYKIANIKNQPRVELKELLGLSGCEISINELAANASVPFVHSHKQNEEVYVVLEGSGLLYIDGDEIELKKGDTVRIDPQGQRCFKASNDGIKFLCVQAKTGSLEQFTMSDGIIDEVKPSWL
ncbi:MULTISPECIES: cupin domain-containing protein [unclassified Campylobacter]|uniref:cupin domain-containing protein n=1 Tax=unclassified Campylobacter TaxID=2593542 RepID=UPI003D3344C9